MSILSRLGFGRGTMVPAVRVEPALTVKAAALDPAITQVGWNGFVVAGAGQSRVRSLPRVTPDYAQRHATVFACCNNIAGDLAKLPLLVEQRDKTGRYVPVLNHPLTYLLNVEGAPGIPAQVVRFGLFYAFALRGRGYAYAPRDGAGEVELIENLPVDRVTELEAGRERFYDFEDGARVRRRAALRNVVHLRYMALDGWTGRSPLEVASESVGLALAGQEAAARAASGTQMRAYAKMEDGWQDDEEFQRNARRLRASLDDPDSNGLPILGAGDSIERLDLSAADQELLASRKLDREQIAALYRMPPFKLGMLDNGVKANGEQQAIDYRTDCLSHWGGFAEAQLAQTLLTERERRAGLRLRLDYEALLIPTTADLFAAIKVAVGGPVMTVEEGRARANLGPLDPEQTLYPPSNMNTKPGADAPAQGG